MDKTSWASSPGVRSRMRQQRSRGTEPELAVRRILHAQGLRYRVHRKVLPGLNRRPDVAFGPARVVLFIDGCFWHGCPEHYRLPKSNPDYWGPKIQRNQERDAETDRILGEAGWMVVRAWEHESPAVIAARVADLVRERRPKPRTLNPVGSAV